MAALPADQSLLTAGRRACAAAGILRVRTFRQEIDVKRFHLKSCGSAALLLALSSPALHGGEFHSSEWIAIDSDDGSAGGADAGDDAVQPMDFGAGLIIGRTFFRTGGGGTHLFRTDMDEGGTLSRSAYAAGFSLRHIASQRLAFSATIGYEFEQYRIRNSTAFAGRGWRDIHHVSLSAGMNLRMTDEWSVFASPALRFGAESGAQWDDAATVSGLIGAAYQVNPDLRLGAGFGVQTRLERRAVVFPLIIVDWKFAEDWRLSTDAGEFFIQPGVDVIYTLNDQWTFAAGLSYLSRGFRLDESGDVPDGVGTFEGFPVRVRATWNASPRMQVSGVAGAFFAGKAQLRDASGNPLGKDNMSAGVQIGAMFEFRF